MAADVSAKPKNCPSPGLSRGMARRVGRSDGGSHFAELTPSTTRLPNIQAMSRLPIFRAGLPDSSPLGLAKVSLGPLTRKRSPRMLGNLFDKSQRCRSRPVGTSSCPCRVCPETGTGILDSARGSRFTTHNPGASPRFRTALNDRRHPRNTRDPAKPSGATGRVHTGQGHWSALANPYSRAFRRTPG